MKLNLGCGNCIIKDYINVDIDGNLSPKPDVIADFRRELPFPSDSIERILLLHTIEHIQKNFHVDVFTEIHRVLKPDAEFIMAYPEFAKCAENWIKNHMGQRDFWEHTIFGRQLSPADFHVCAMNTTEVVESLRCVGFVNIVNYPEKDDPYYTVVKAYKGVPRPTWSEHIKQEVFGVS